MLNDKEVYVFGVLCSLIAAGELRSSTDKDVVARAFGIVDLLDAEAAALANRGRPLPEQKEKDQ